jgi:enoyl-CoA hydratase/carnithine racemase
MQAIRRAVGNASSRKLVELVPPNASRVAVLRLNAPESLNALTIDMGEQFEATVHTLMEDCQDLGAVVVTGAGRAFSAGGDLDFLRRRHKDSPSRNAVVMRRFYERFLSVRKLPVVSLDGYLTIVRTVHAWL